MADYSELYRNHFTEQLKQSGQYAVDDLSRLEIPDDVVKILSQDMVIQYHIIPVGLEGNRLVLVTDTEQTFKMKNKLEGLLGRKVKLLYTSEESLKLGALKYYSIASFKRSGSQHLQNIAQLAEGFRVH